MRIFWATCRVILVLLSSLATVPVHAEEAPIHGPVEVHADMLDGSTYSLAEQRGMITALVMWSPDSLASRKSMGEIDRFFAAYRSREVNMLAVSTVRDAELLRQFAAQRNLQVPMAMLGEHNLGKLKEQQLPIVYVFDRDGKFHSMHVGLLNYRVIEKLVAPLVR